MGFLQTIIQQLGDVINSQSVARKMVLLLIVLVTMGGMGWLAMRAKSGGHVTVIEQMSPNDVGEALAKLKQLGIDAKAGPNNTSLMVSRREADQASIELAQNGLLNSGQLVGYEKMDQGSIGQSNFQQKKQYLRMREGELARTLVAIKNVQRARVHLAIPEQSVFIEEEQFPTASVNLVLRSGRKLSPAQVEGIVNLVSYAVEGMKPEHVSVVDQEGNLMTSAKAVEVNLASTAHQRFKTTYEQQIKENIERQLGKFVGVGKVDARVSAEFDFSTLQREREMYNPDEQDEIKLREETLYEGRNAGDSKDQRSPGSGSNLPLEPEGGEGVSTAVSAAGSRASQTSKIEYAVSRTVEVSSHTSPTPERISVSVAVDGVYEPSEDAVEGEEATLVFSKRSPNELADFEELVKATMGYDAERGDVVKVQCHQFMRTENDGAMPKFTDMMLEWLLVNGWQVFWTALLVIFGFLAIFFVFAPAVKEIVKTPVADRRQSLPGGASARGLPAGRGPAQVGNSGEGEQLAEIRERMQEAGIVHENIDDMSESQLVDLAQKAGLSVDAMKDLKMEALAAAAKVSSMKSEQVQEQVNEAVRNDPVKTVGLLRAWMEESN